MSPKEPWVPIRETGELKREVMWLWKQSDRSHEPRHRVLGKAGRAKELLLEVYRGNPSNTLCPEDLLSDF